MYQPGGGTQLESTRKATASANHRWGKLSSMEQPPADTKGIPRGFYFRKHLLRQSTRARGAGGLKRATSCQHSGFEHAVFEQPNRRKGTASETSMIIGDSGLSLVTLVDPVEYYYQWS